MLLFSEKTQQSTNIFKLSILCAAVFLSACGGGSGSSSSTGESKDPIVTPEQPFSINVTSPFRFENVSIQVFDADRKSPLAELEKVSGTNFRFDLNRDFLKEPLTVEVTGSASQGSKVFDPISQKYINFYGALHSINPSDTGQIYWLHPASEAIYQRSLIRAGYQNIDDDDPITNISSEHINMAKEDVNTALLSAFEAANLPTAETVDDLKYLVGSSDHNRINFTFNQTFLSLGYLELWQQHFPSANAYADFSKQLSIDLTDGYLDGRSVRGFDQQLSKALVNAPVNSELSQIDLLSIAENQKQVRESFADELKASVLAVAKRYNQDQIYPINFAHLSQMEYSGSPRFNNTVHVRIKGAGDYRRAFGFSADNLCTNSRLPCVQGLNADDQDSGYNQIEYLVGDYTASNGCSLKINNLGDVTLTKNGKTWRSRVDRDVGDHLLLVNAAQQHYILNAGSTESDPPFYIQMNIKQMQVTDATAGTSITPYPEQLSQTEASCVF